MALNLDIIGKPIGPMHRDYTWKDTVLYALGVGAGFEELDFCFEKNLKTIPTFSIAMLFDFLSQATLASGVNLAGLLHGEQELIFHRPIPPSGALITTGRIAACYDKGKEKGALIEIVSDTDDGVGNRLFTSIVTAFGRLDGGWGGQDRPKRPVVFPSREPDHLVEATPGIDQPLLYRLSGDIFHLHVDPAFARLAGFERPIMHGLCTCGYACRALMSRLTPGQPERVRRIACRFSAALYPGVPIRTLIWETGDGTALWRTVNARDDRVVIDHGRFEYGDPAVAAVGGTGGKAAAGDRSPGGEDGLEERPAGFTSAAAVFAAMPGAFVAAAAVGVAAVFQYDIAGAGTWHCTVREGTCTVASGRHASPSCTLSMTQEDFLDMMNGRLPPMQALAGGRLRLAGDLFQAQLLKSSSLWAEG